MANFPYWKRLAAGAFYVCALALSVILAHGTAQGNGISFNSERIGEFYHLPEWMPTNSISNPADTTQIVCTTNVMYVSVVTNMAYSATTNDTWTAQWGEGQTYTLDVQNATYRYGGIYPTDGDWFAPGGMQPSMALYQSKTDFYLDWYFDNPELRGYKAFPTNNMHRLVCDDEHQLWRTIEIVPDVHIGSIVTNYLTDASEVNIPATNILVEVSTNYIVEAVTNDVWTRISDGQQFPLTQRWESGNKVFYEWSIDDGYSAVEMDWNKESQTGEILYFRWLGEDKETDDVWAEGSCVVDSEFVMSFAVTPTNTETGAILDTENFSRTYDIVATTNLASIVAVPVYDIHIPQSIVTNFEYLVTNVAYIATNTTITVITNDYWVSDGFYNTKTGASSDTYEDWPPKGTEMWYAGHYGDPDDYFEHLSWTGEAHFVEYYINREQWALYRQGQSYSAWTNASASVTNLAFSLYNPQILALLHHELDIDETTNVTLTTVYETTNQTTRARLRADKYASIVAANEAIIERALYMGGSTRRPIPDVLEDYTFNYGSVSISGDYWLFDPYPTKRIEHLSDYLSFTDLAKSNNRYSVFKTPDAFQCWNYQTNDPPVEVASTLFDKYEPSADSTFAYFDWVSSTQKWTEATFPQGGGVTFGCIPPDEVLLTQAGSGAEWGDMGAAWGLVEKHDGTLADADVFKAKFKPTVTNSLPEIIGTTPLKNCDYWTDDTQRLNYNRLATYSSLYAIADRSYHYGYDLTWDVPQCYTVQCYTVSVPYTNVYYIGSVSVSESGDLLGYNTFAQGIGIGGFGTNITIYAEIPTDSPHHSWAGTGAWTKSTYGGVVTALTEVQHTGLPKDFSVTVPGPYNVTTAALQGIIDNIFDGSPLITGTIGYSHLDFDSGSYVVYYSGSAQTQSGTTPITWASPVDVSQASGTQAFVGGDIDILYSTLETYQDTSHFDNTILAYPDRKAFSTGRVKHLEVGSFAIANVVTNQYAFSWNRLSLADHDGYNVWLNPDDGEYTRPASKCYKMQSTGQLTGSRAYMVQRLKSYATQEVMDLRDETHALLDLARPGWRSPAAFGVRNARKVKNVWESSGTIGLQASVGAYSQDKRIAFEAQNGQLTGWEIIDNGDEPPASPSHTPLDAIPDLVTVSINLAPTQNEGVDYNLDPTIAVETEAFHMYRTDWNWKTLNLGY